MTQLIYLKYSNSNSHEIVEKLSKDYFDVIDALCKTAGDTTIKLKTLSATDKHAPSLYANLCLALVEEIKHLINQRRDSIAPYVKELNEKVEHGHDCANCSTGCAVKHASKIPEIEESHHRIREMMNRLERIASPLYSETDYAGVYKTLRNEMLIMQTTLSELFLIEESVLIPKILKEQKEIHARR